MILLAVLFFTSFAIWLVFLGRWIYFLVKHNMDKMFSTVIGMLCCTIIINILNLIIKLVK